jgi:[lysine-biosynthesis-protein LysW]--L-2-aminoadipate ligase
VKAMPVLALLHSTIRKEEKLIIDAAKKQRVDVKIIDIRKECLNPHTYPVDFDVALERSVSTVKGDYGAEFFHSLNIPVVNSPGIRKICEDKFLTSLQLRKAGIPTPKFAVVFNVESAKTAVDQMNGYPVVLKPVVGSWGRLLAKINDVDALETVLDHKNVLGSPQQKIFYMQDFIDKPGRDIRAFIIGKEPVCAIYRKSPHWITNTARGGTAFNCRLDDELVDICRGVSSALGEGVLAVDIFETPLGYSVNEVNHTMEFRNSEEPTGVRISHKIVNYCIAKTERETSK